MMFCDSSVGLLQFDYHAIGVIVLTHDCGNWRILLAKIEVFDSIFCVNGGVKVPNVTVRWCVDKTSGGPIKGLHKPKFHLARHVSTRHVRCVDRVVTTRVELCCSTSSTQTKCMGSTRRTCRVSCRNMTCRAKWNLGYTHLETKHDINLHEKVSWCECSGTLS